MEAIKTKFNIGDIVYAIIDTPKPEIIKIQQIVIVITENKTEIRYTNDKWNYEIKGGILEQCIGKTKEEAIQDLNERTTNQSFTRYNPQEKRFFVECLKILQNK